MFWVLGSQVCWTVLKLTMSWGWPWISDAHASTSQMEHHAQFIQCWDWTQDLRHARQMLSTNWTTSLTPSIVCPVFLMTSHQIPLLYVLLTSNIKYAEVEGWLGICGRWRRECEYAIASFGSFLVSSLSRLFAVSPAKSTCIAFISSLAAALFIVGKFVYICPFIFPFSIWEFYFSSVLREMHRRRTHTCL